MLRLPFLEPIRLPLSTPYLLPSLGFDLKLKCWSTARMSPVFVLQVVTRNAVGCFVICFSNSTEAGAMQAVWTYSHIISRSMCVAVGCRYEALRFDQPPNVSYFAVPSKARKQIGEL